MKKTNLSRMSSLDRSDRSKTKAKRLKIFDFNDYMMSFPLFWFIFMCDKFCMSKISPNTFEQYEA